MCRPVIDPGQPTASRVHSLEHALFNLDHGFGVHAVRIHLQGGTLVPRSIPILLTSQHRLRVALQHHVTHRVLLMECKGLGVLQVQDWLRDADVHQAPRRTQVSLIQECASLVPLGRRK